MENQSTTHKLIVTEWLTLAAIFVGCFFFLHTEITALDCRIESRIQLQESRIQAQEQRSDRLYEMYVQALKESSEMRKDMDQKFYDLLKESRK